MVTLGVAFVVIAVFGLDVALVYAIGWVWPRFVENVRQFWNPRLLAVSIAVTAVLVAVMGLALRLP